MALLMRHRLARSPDWLRAHPWTGTSFCMGALAGLFLRLPLIPYELPDSAATFFATALGAAITVLGASWIAESKEHREKRDARNLIQRELGTIRSLFEKLPPEVAAQQFRSTSSAANSFRTAVHELDSRMSKLEKLFERVGPHGYIAFADMVKVLSELRRLSDLIAHTLSTPDNHLLPEKAYKSRRGHTMDVVKKLDEIYAVL